MEKENPRKKEIKRLKEKYNSNSVEDRLSRVEEMLGFK